MDVIKLLLVEDDDDYRTVIKGSLELTGEYKVYEAKNGLEGFEVLNLSNWILLLPTWICQRSQGWK
jgi:CheY-like chemotaxis protein